MTVAERMRAIDLLTYYTLGAYEGAVAMIDCITDAQLKTNLVFIREEYKKQRAEIERRFEETEEAYR